jgi:Zinc knuckle
MADDTMGLKYHKCPPFDGQVEGFLSWYLKFGNYAFHQGFKRVITTEIDVRMPLREDSPRDSDPGVADEEEAAMAENKAAYAHLANCLTATRDLAYVRSGVTEEWPNGLASLVIKCMFHRYKPDDATAMAECQSKLLKLRLGPTANPGDLFTQIADIQAQYESVNYTIDRPTIVSTVLRAAPQPYKSTITAVQVMRGNQMTMTDLEDAMDLYYRNSINNGKVTSRAEEGEVVLSGFTGNCYKCGEAGHTKANCPKNANQVTKAKTSKHKIPRRKCETCGKEHAGPCWEDEANAKHRPPNWKSSKAGANIAAVVVDANEDGEYVLSGISDMDWSKVLTPEGKGHQEDIEADSARGSVVDDVAEGVITYHRYWFPYEWFLDSLAYTEQTDDQSVMSDSSVMRIDNKNRKFELVDQIANGYSLENELGLKAAEKAIKQLTFPNVRALL